MRWTPISLGCELVGVGLFGALCAAGCAGDKTDACHDGGGLGTRVAALEAVDRKVVGLAAPYVPDLGLAARDAELAGSIAARRAAAWQVIGKVLAPVPLGDPRLADNFGGVQPVIPTWHTWYGHDDFERVFKKLYVDLGPTGRRARAPFGDAAITAGLEWNTYALDGLPSWPEQRYLDYLAAIDEAEEPDGIGGISRVTYSPGTLRHILTGYAKTYACRLAGEPPAFATDPVKHGQDVVATEAIAVAGCEWRPLGPYIVADGAPLSITLTGTGDADLYLRRGAPADDATYDCKSAGGGASETCVIEGGGVIYAGVLGFGDGADVAATVRYREADVRDPTCLDGELPRDAVVIKADWRRVDFNATLPAYDTSGPRMAVRLRPDGSADWGPGDGDEDPGPASIYTMKLPNGATYRLAGLHVMTKELTHWVWITMWWSNDPGTDFGADRPAAIAALPGPWRNYKMCISTAYLEGDPDPRGGFTGSLGDALASVHGGQGAPTWCSNPYLEIGAGNADTNCIGCHQHGGSMTITPEVIISEPMLYPHHGRTRVRNNFFTDYSWAIQGGRGDDLAAVIQGEIEYWDASDP